MSRVVLRAVRLRGFGRFQAVTARFSPGLTVLVRPNEWGKSTLVAGIEAGLFGFRYAAAERAGRLWLGGRERYRSWYGGDAFDASVVFETGGQLFQLYREFESGRVVLRSRPADGPVPQDALEPPPAARGKGSGGWVQHFRGLHRPGGSRTAEPFEEVLQRVIGLSSAELFEQTFCLTQRLPEAAQLDAAVQQLITGAGTAGLEGARRWLVELGKSLTTRTDELGLTPKAGRVPQKEEQIEARIRELSAGLEAARSRLDAQAPVKEALAKAEEELEELQRRVKEQAQTLEALEGWLGGWHRRQELLRQQVEISKALARARELEGLVARHRERLLREFTDVAAVGADAAERLQKLAVEQENLDRFQRMESELQREIEERRGQLRDLYARLEQEYPDLHARPDLAQLPARHRLLVDKAAEVEKMRQRIAELEQRRRALQQQLAGLAPWADRGPGPSAEIAPRREQAQQFLAKWGAIQQLYGRRDALQRQIEAEFGPFQTATARQLEALRTYPARRAELESRAEALEARIERGEAAWRELEEAEARLAEAHADLVELERRLQAAGGPGLVEHLEQRLEAARQRELAGKAVERLARAGASLSRRVRGAAARWLAGALALALGGGVAAGLGADRGRLAAAVAWLLAAAAGAHALRLFRRLAQARQAARRLHALAGAASGEDPEALAREVERARQFEQARRSYGQQRALLVQQGLSRESLAEERAILARLEEEKADLDRQVEPFVGRYGAGAAEALEAWQRLTSEIRGIEASIRTHLSDLGVAGAAQAPGEDHQPVPEAGELEAMALPPGVVALSEWLVVASSACGRLLSVGQVATLGDFAGWVAGLDDGFWGQAQESARRYEELSREFHRVMGELEGLQEGLKEGGGGAGAVGKLELLQQELNALRQELAPFDEAADHEELAGRVRSCLALQQELRELEREVQHKEELLEANRRQAQECGQRAAELRQGLQPLLGRAGGDLQASRERLRAFAELNERLRAEQDELRGLLQAFGVESTVELEARERAVERSIRAHEERLEMLEQQHPALPRHHQAPDVALLDRYHSQLKEQLEQARREAAAAGERRDQLLRRHIGLEAVPIINVAAAELELARLREERLRVREEALAVAEAYRQLEAAAVEYHQGFRRELEAIASRLFSRFSRRPGRRVRVDEQFRIQVVDPDGQVYSPQALSQGARDQLFIAMRLTVAAMVDRELRLPFVLDDPFVHCDETRLAEIRAAVEEVARSSQVILMTHRRELAAWGEPVEVEEAGE